MYELLFTGAHTDYTLHLMTCAYWISGLIMRHYGVIPIPVHSLLNQIDTNNKMNIS